VKITNMIIKILFQKRMLLLWWFIALAAIMGLTMSFFPAFRGNSLGDSFNNLPAGVQKIIGDSLSFTTVSGYVQQQVFALRAPVLAIILSIIVFGGQVAGEEQKGVTETHLSLPISRTKLLLSKLVAGMIITLLATLGIIVGIELALFFINESYSFAKILQSTLGAWLVGLVFGLLSFAVGAVSGHKAPSIGMPSALAFLTYLVSSMAASVSWLEPLNKFTPFYYYSNGLISFSHAIGLGVVCLVLVTIGVIGFNRRDLRT
jgi:ABC-2 type transport system permease protein